MKYEGRRVKINVLCAVCRVGSESPPRAPPWRSLLAFNSNDELNLSTFSKKILYSCFLILTVDFAALGERLVPLVG